MICKYCGSDVTEAACDPKDAIPAELDTEAFREAWASWIKHRREKRQTLRPTSIGRQMSFLLGLGEAGAIASIEQSIKNGWTGLFEPKEPIKVQGKTDPERERAIALGWYRPSSGVPYDPMIHRGPR